MLRSSSISSASAWWRVRGITVDASLTHFFQELASGDGEQDIQSGGKGDILIAFDGQKLGLWQGLFMNMHGELIYGADANTQGDGTIIPVNTALAFPQLGGSDEELSLTLSQQFNAQTTLALGKFNMLDAAARTPLIGGGGLETFMNLGLAAPISGVTPAYILGGFLTHRTDRAALGLFVYDPRSAQDPRQQGSGIDDVERHHKPADDEYKAQDLTVNIRDEGVRREPVPRLFAPRDEKAQQHDQREHDPGECTEQHATGVSIRFGVASVAAEHDLTS